MSKLEDLAARAARAGGDVLSHRFGRPSGVGAKSASGDLVSDADRASERAVADMLLAARPDDGLIGEEGAQRDASSGLRWVIDPLDGTSNYLYGLPGWCVSVAVEERGDQGWRALAGAVCNPLADELFRASRGSGAWLEGRAQPLAVNDPVALDRALIGTGFSYDRSRRAQQGLVAGALLPRVRDLRRLGAAAYDLCLLAAGRLDGFYEDQLQRWDWSAGALIASEAGAVVAALDEGLCAAGPALHPELRRALDESGSGRTLRD